MLSLEAGGFSCTLALKSFMEKFFFAILIMKVFFTLNFSFRVIKNGDPNPIPDHKMPGSGCKFEFNEYGSATLLSENLSRTIH